MELYELAETFSMAQAELSKKAKALDAFFTLSRLETVFLKFEADQAAFPLSRDSARHVLASLIPVINSTFYEDNTRAKMKANFDANAELDAWMWYSIRAQLDGFRHVLTAECRNSETYFIEKKVGFDIPTLLHSAEENLHQSIRPHVPAAAQRELREAGRCLALECYTACGFHTLRALEVVMGAYFKTFSKSEKEFRSWHDYVEALEKLAKEATESNAKYPSAKVAAMLDRMRQLHRNPLMHPEDNLDEMGADMLLKLGVVTIAELASDMRDSAGQTEMKLIVSQAKPEEQQSRATAG